MPSSLSVQFRITGFTVQPSFGIQEGEILQRLGESVPYSLTTTNLVSGPTGATGTVTRLSDNSLVTTTMMPTSSGLPITGDVIYFRIISATANERYRVDISFNTLTASAIFKPFVFFRGEF